jgi:hypothetical protein
MGVDFYNCSVCNEIFSDAGYYGYCINCEGMLCGHCHDKMAEKHGYIGDDHEKASWYGEEAVNHCDTCDKPQTEEIKQQLFERVEKFMKDNGVVCEETIHQCDWVIENAYEFMSDLFNIIEPVLPKENEEE